MILAFTVQDDRSEELDVHCEIEVRDKAATKPHSATRARHCNSYGSSFIALLTPEERERSTEIHVDSGQHRIYRLALSSAGEVSINPIN